MFNKLPSLYRLPPGTCCWGGGGVDYSGMEDAANRAAMLQMQMFQEAKTLMKPATDILKPAVEQVGGLLGLPGYTALDPTKTLEATPGYQFLLEQGNKALSRYGAATGLSLSGPAALSAQRFGQGTAQQYAWGPYMSALTGQEQLGAGAAGTVGGWGMQAGQLVGQDWMAAAQADVQGQIARANQQNQMWGDIFGGIGFLGGSILGMPGVGSAIGGGIGNMFGGGYQPAGGSAISAAASAPAFGASYTPSPFFMAAGGPTNRNQPYVVGERGPELFVPDTSGFIIPNHLTGYSAYTPWAS